ncbi:Cx9C motif-containing protein 4 [Argiope bruennichi]|uniref:Cx9C motif-containing protein 4 n=1 Tax=Argiope bruennichi TaxID=94029 RepID=A0A8T0F0P8_ARGBR|nr:Cx9C motif-containing protein 4 [Argiope bruennichi]
MSCGIVPWASVLCELMTPDPCYSKALDMQRCLKANRYREGVCFSSMSVMEKCCNRWKDRSACCVLYEKSRPPSKVQTQAQHNDTERDHFILSELFISH